MHILRYICLILVDFFLTLCWYTIYGMLKIIFAEMSCGGQSYIPSVKYMIQNTNLVCLILKSKSQTSSFKVYFCFEGKMQKIRTETMKEAAALC